MDLIVFYFIGMKYIIVDLISSIYGINFIDYFFQIISFLPFLFFLNTKVASDLNLDALTFIGALADEDDVDVDISYTYFNNFFNFYSNSDFFEFSMFKNYDLKLNEFLSSVGDFGGLNKNITYTEIFFNTFYFEFEFFDYSIIYLVGLFSSYFLYEITDDAPSSTLNFLQLATSLIGTTDDIFILFLGFELLTISTVFIILLDCEKYMFNRHLITYFILSVAVSLIIFFICFFIILVCTGTNSFSFLNFSTFFFDTAILFESSTNLVLMQFYTYCLKFFFLNLIILFMFKFAVGPVAIWTIYIYPAFPTLILVFQMIFLKYSLYFLFLELFDFIFLFNCAVISFCLKAFSFILIISMFIGCFAYKINDLRSILIITTFSQIAYISIGFLNPSFLILVYSLNYFLLYLYSVFVLFLIFLIVNSMYNIKNLHELVLLRYIDFGLYISIIAIIFSLSGLPPFIGFFVKYLLLLKILTNPLLFKFGVILLLTSFITTYIYLSVAYNLMKTSDGLKSFIQLSFFTNSKFIFLGQKTVIIEEIISFFLNGGVYMFIFFLLSPTIVVLVPEIFDFIEFFYEWNTLRLVDLLDFYLDS